MIYLDCDHCFCFDCLRSWKKSKTVGSEVSQLCPVCRKKFKFIVPSRTFCTGKTRKIAIKTFKDRTSKMPCKYFRGIGSCPFGKSCLYAHLNEDGVSLKEWDCKRSRYKKSLNQLFFFDWD